jgi:hypothetical protein
VGVGYEGRSMSEAIKNYRVAISLAVVVFCMFGCVGCEKKPEIKADFSTPEGAILCLENAYRAKDIEAAVRCWDFYFEGKRMLEDTFEILSEDEETLKRMADTLERAYRKEIEVDGFPDFNGVKSTFPSKEFISANVVKVTEVCVYPEGGTSRQDILVGKSGDEWKVLYPL